MHRKGAQDSKRAKLFTKLLREVLVAAKIGPDPDSNPRLRTALTTARNANVPKDKIQNMINKATNSPEEGNFDEIRYEGYSAGGAAIMVEALTDNRNRTASEVRAAFTKFGGQLGETGSVNFLFKKTGQIVYSKAVGDFDKVFEASIKAGADDCEFDDESYEIICDPDNFAAVRDHLEDMLGASESANIAWKPLTTQELTVEGGEKLLKLIDALDDCEDVQNVVGNFEFPEELLQKLQNA